MQTFFINNTGTQTQVVIGSFEGETVTEHQFEFSRTSFEAVPDHVH